MKRNITNLGRHYESEIERATTIDELVWIEMDYKQDMALSCRDLMDLCRISGNKKENLKDAGQKYTRATKPAWR